MPHDVTLITTIAVALGLALILGFVAARLKLPALVGYLLAGVQRARHAGVCRGRRAFAATR